MRAKGKFCDNTKWRAGARRHYSRPSRSYLDWLTRFADCPERNALRELAPRGLGESLIDARRHHSTAVLHYYQRR
jgi:hypothetical protein